MRCRLRKPARLASFLLQLSSHCEWCDTRGSWGSWDTILHSASPVTKPQNHNIYMILRSKTDLLEVSLCWWNSESPRLCYCWPLHSTTEGTIIRFWGSMFITHTESHIKHHRKMKHIPYCTEKSPWNRLCIPDELFTWTLSQKHQENIWSTVYRILDFFPGDWYK